MDTKLNARIVHLAQGTYVSIEHPHGNLDVLLPVAPTHREAILLRANELRVQAERLMKRVAILEAAASHV